MHSISLVHSTLNPPCSLTVHIGHGGDFIIHVFDILLTQQHALTATLRAAIPSITNPLVFTLGSSSSTLTCTSTGSVATNITFIRDGTTVGTLRDGESMEFGGVTYQMTQTVTNRAQSTYQNVLTIKQPLAGIIGSSFTCRVENTLGTSFASHPLTAGLFNFLDIQHLYCQ